jgi:hypothetical protein
MTIWLQHMTASQSIQGLLGLFIAIHLRIVVAIAYTNRDRSQNECRDVAVLRLYKVSGQRIFQFGRCLIISAIRAVELLLTLSPISPKKNTQKQDPPGCFYHSAKGIKYIVDYRRFSITVHCIHSKT